jgi:hypothetical protein
MGLALFSPHLDRWVCDVAYIHVHGALRCTFLKSHIIHSYLFTLLQCRHFNETQWARLLCHQHLLFLVADTHFLCLHTQPVVVFQGYH